MASSKDQLSHHQIWKIEDSVNELSHTQPKSYQKSCIGMGGGKHNI